MHTCQYCKRFIKQLKKEKKLVKKWNDKTYLQALNEGDREGSHKQMFAPNMLKRVVSNYQNASNREVPDDGIFEMDECPFYKSPARQS